MATPRTTVQPIIEIIEGLGGEFLRLETSRHHPRVYFAYKGHERFYVTSASPSDWRYLNNVKSDIRNMMRSLDDLNSAIRGAEPELAPVATVTRVRALPALGTVGDRLKFAREQQQLSRWELSQRSTIPAELIANTEAGTLCLTDSQLTKVINSLGVGPDYFLGKQEVELKPQEEIMAITLAERYVQARNAAHMTNGTIAAQTGINPKVLADIENGLLADHYRLREVAKTLGVSLEWMRGTEAAAQQVIRDKIELGRFLAKRRTELGINQAEAAKRIGVKQTVLSRAERGAFVYAIHGDFDKVASALKFDKNKVLGHVLQRDVRGTALVTHTRPYRPEPQPTTTPPAVGTVQETPELPPVAPPAATLPIEDITSVLRSELEKMRVDLVAAQKDIIKQSVADFFHQMVDEFFGIGKQK